MNFSFFLETRSNFPWIIKPVALMALGLIASFLQGAETGLAGYWKMDEVSGTTVADSSGNGNDGTLTNANTATAWVAGKKDGAISLDGADDIVTIPHNNSLNVGGAFTLAAWIYPRGFAYGRIVHRGTSTTSMYDLALADGGALALKSSASYTTASGLVQLNAWQHIAVTYDGTTLRFYIQGLEQANTAISLTIADSVEPLQIGNRDELNRGFLGNLDEVRVYNRAISAVEVQALSGTIVGQGPTLQLEPGTVYQTISGWEFTSIGWEYNKIQNIYDPTWVQYAPLVCDRVVNEMGMNRIRLELQSGIENPLDRWPLFTSGQLSQTDWDSFAYEKFNDDNDPYNANMAGFQFGRLDFEVENIVLPTKASLEANGQKLYLNVNYVDFAWTSNKGTLSHSGNPQEYAEFILVYFDHLRTKYGLIPDALEMILEPDNSNGWGGTQIGQAIVAVVNRLHAAGYDPEIIAPSNANPQKVVTYYNSLSAVPGAQAYVNTLSYHRYGTNNTTNIADAGKTNGIRTAMLEYIDATLTDFLDDLLVGNVSAWNQWGLATRNPSNVHYLYYADLTDPANPLFTLTSNMKSVECYTKFVHPGAVRIGATINGSITSIPAAFINEDGNYVVVFRTTLAEANPMSISGLPVGTYGLRSRNSSLTIVNYPDLVVQDGVPAQVLLPVGVTTLYGKNAPTAMPEIEVKREGMMILDGNTDRVDATATGVPLGLSYTIANTGALPLTLGAPTISRMDNCSVAVITNPGNTISPGASTELKLDVTPTTVGGWSCEISMGTNDLNESPAHWWLAGTASSTATPEIHCTRAGIPVLHQFIEPVETIKAGLTSPLIYKVSNLGTGALSIGVPSITSTVNCVAVVSTTPASSLAAGASTTMEIQVLPAAAGDWSYTVSFTSNDSNENPVIWTCAGNAISGTDSLSVVPESVPVLNATSGRYEQKITVINGGTNATGGFELLLTNVPVGVSILGGVLQGNTWTVAYSEIVDTDKPIEVLLEYAAGTNPGTFSPSISLVAAPPSPSEADPNFGSSIYAVSIEQGTGEFTMRFVAGTGRRYQVEYSDDLTDWAPASVVFEARNKQVEWRDNGGMTGSILPVSGKRFFRIRDLTGL